jgi:peptidoglycan-associated lipoprotein
MQKWIRYSMLMMALAAAGCASKGVEPPAPVDSSKAAPGAGAATQPGTAGADAGGSALASAAGIPAQRVIYFDYDKSDVRAEANAILDAHAKYLAQNPQARARLEGHADERGSREYNLALGELRAQAASNYLMIRGVQSQQLSAFSYGEEKPAAEGHDDSSWQQNRRVEMVYQ